jgi:hypothetical protein
VSLSRIEPVTFEPGDRRAVRQTVFALTTAVIDCCVFGTSS